MRTGFDMQASLTLHARKPARSYLTISVNLKQNSKWLLSVIMEPRGGDCLMKITLKSKISRQCPFNKFPERKQRFLWLYEKESRINNITKFGSSCDCMILFPFYFMVIISHTWKIFALNAEYLCSMILDRCCVAIYRLATEDKNYVRCSYSQRL
jgi:hypothetical protein